MKKHYLIFTLCLVFLFAASLLIIHKFTSNDSSEKELVYHKNEIYEDIPEPTLNIAKEQPSAEIVISSVGDITLGTDDTFPTSTSLPTVFRNSKDREYLFKNVADIFKNDNLTTANLETTFTNATEKREKKFNFKGEPALANTLVLGSIEGVNISNNHIFDYNQEGFNDTIKTLKDYRINYFGEGSKWLTTINGIKFGFLGYQGWNNDNKLQNQIKKDITDLKAENRIVIINFHWGEEKKYTPNNTQKALAHYAIDNGADVIIGHHPHVIQGIEKYKGKFIAYSLGNFCFGGNSNPPDKDTFILQSKFKFNNGSLTAQGLRVIPCSISSVNYKNDYSPTPLTGIEKAKFLDKLNSLNINMNSKIEEDFIYSNFK